MWDPVPQPGIKPRAPALRVWSLSHWTTREFHFSCIFNPSLPGKGWSVIPTRNVKTLGFADFLTSILCIIWLLILLTCPNHAQTISMLTEQMTVWSLIQVADHWPCGAVSSTFYWWRADSGWSAPFWNWNGKWACWLGIRWAGASFQHSAVLFSAAWGLLMCFLERWE